MSSESDVNVPTALGLVLRAGDSDFITKLLQEDQIFEAAETDLTTRLLRAGDVCLDAGCHVGYYTCLMASLVAPGGKVHAFDANPRSCFLTRQSLSLNNLEAEVIHAALGDSRGTTSFNISSDEQTGLSSLGDIPTRVDTIAVPWLRLEDFVKERGMRSVRLLKIDVEGAEELVLRGLGDVLQRHVIEYILLECYDERLKAMDTSTEGIVAILQEAEYSAWEFGTKAPSGWSATDKVVSRGDCNYLFASPRVRERMPQLSIAGALSSAMLRNKEITLLQAELTERKKHIERLQNDLSISLDEMRNTERDIRELHNLVQAMRNSLGWRLFNPWRRLRDVVLPQGSILRRYYDALLQPLRGSSGNKTR